MVIAFILALSLSQTPEPGAAVDLAPVSPPPAGQLRAWLPWQGHLAFNAMALAPRSSLGVDAYFGRSVGLGEFGATGHGGGWFWGYGAHGVFGSSESPDCREGSHCVGRWIAGPSLRAGRAWGFLRDEPQAWPDGYAYLEAFGFLGRASLDSAPLRPADAFFEAGARLSLAVNLVGWTRFATSGMGSLPSVHLSGEGAMVLITWLALALTNHFELNVELSRGVAGPMTRAGFTVGAGF